MGKVKFHERTSNHNVEKKGVVGIWCKQGYHDSCSMLSCACRNSTCLCSYNRNLFRLEAKKRKKK